jgi:hypothetical protein
MLENIIGYLFGRKSQTCITENKDLDREIFNLLTDEEVIKLWNVNRRIYYDVFDDAYLRRRLKKYSDIEIYKEKDETWKRFFVRSTYYIFKLKNLYKFNYSSGDFKKYRRLLENEKKRHYLDILGCRKGDLSLFTHGFKKSESDLYIYEAVSFGQLNILKYIQENGIGEIANFRKLEFLEKVSNKGYLDVLKYFIEDLKLDFHNREEIVLRNASASGHLDIVKYVVERGADVNINQGSPLRSAALEGHFEIVKYLVEKGSIISPKGYEFAKKNRHYHIADYLDKHFVYKKLEV